MGNAAPDDLLWREPDQGLAGEADGAGARRHHARERTQQRRLARAVRADEAHDLAAFDDQADVVQHADVAISGAQPCDLEERGCHGSAPLGRGVGAEIGAQISVNHLRVGNDIGR